ncbi:hypothetical protein AF331_18795 [Rossellomorea marisflavi]|uniref:Glycosyltransferase 2-like domain-containing protein n=1 Tax=Rossellomorea marisflavi TaxID=189381 RepID=A0A0M0G090_9BACI|nr:glycosyltransferase [Rossellomorea marisflavi]KON82896.1 hypothetical protein AF331_18795 [Rossellomorea marisflavi]
MSYCCAGIVLYNPEMNRLRENIDSIKGQVDKIILIDNNSTNIKEILHEYEGEDNFNIIKNSDNKGIATALNQICYKALELEYEWVLLLDQDSISSSTMVYSYEKYTHNQSTALISPYIVDINKLKLDDYLLLDLPESTIVEWAITSGSLIRLSTWRKVGKFYEDMFIDVVDLDYSMRLKINGYKQIRVNYEYLLQEVGQAEKTFIFRPHKDNSGKWTLKRYYRTNHSLIRQYYMTRNHIIFARKYSNYKPTIKHLLFTFAMIFPKPFIEKNKFKLTMNLLKGICDGYIFNVKKYKKL